MSLENQLRLLVANRHVAWLVDDLPEACIQASRFSWRNDFFADRTAGRPSRAIVLSPDKVKAALALVVPGGCAVLIEPVESATPPERLPGYPDRRLDCGDGHLLTIIFGDTAYRSLESAPGEVRHLARLSPPGWCRSAHRIIAAIWKKRLVRRRDIARFLRDVATLDSAMAPFYDRYLAQLPDHPGRIDPALHYLIEGADQGFDPIPDFSTRHYLTTYRDVAAEDFNPLLHYLRHGQHEGRLPMPLAAGRQTLPASSPDQLATLVRRSPVADLWMASGAGESVSIDWPLLVIDGPCTVILLSTDEAATARWLEALPRPGAIRELAIVIAGRGAGSRSTKGWPRCDRPVGEDLVTAALAMTITDRVVLCADYVRPVPDALGLLASHVDNSHPLCVGRLMSPAGMMLSPAPGSDVDARRFWPSGDALAPRWFVSGTALAATPHLIAGTRTAIGEAVGDWQRGGSPSALMIPRAMAFVGEALYAPQQPSVDLGVSPTHAPLTIAIDDWATIIATDGFAFRSFLLDVAAVFGRVRLYCRTQLLTLSGLEWLGAFGIEYDPVLANWDGQRAPAADFVAVGPGQSSNSEPLVRNLLETTVSLRRLRNVYAGQSQAMIDALGAACTGALAQQALCLCPTATAADMIANWTARLTLGDIQGARLLAVGAHAGRLIAAGLPASGLETRSVEDDDWLRFADGADVIVSATPDGSDGKVDCRRINRYRMLNFTERDKAIHRLASLSEDRM